MKTINTTFAPDVIGPYSQAVLKNGILFVSSCIGINPVTKELGKSFEIQVENVFACLQQILNVAGFSLTNVVKVTVYLKDMLNYDKFNDMYVKFFQQPYPAREAVEVSRLARNAAIEVSLIAMQ